MGDVVGQAGALDRLLRLEDLTHHRRRFLRCLDRQAERLADNPGGDGARRNAVDADAGFAELHRHAFSEMDHGGLGRAVDHRRRETGEPAGDAAVVDDAAGVLRRMWGVACFTPSITLRSSVAIAASKRATVMRLRFGPTRPVQPPQRARGVGRLTSASLTASSF
jgi:hypothetical protein